MHLFRPCFHFTFPRCRQTVPKRRRLTAAGRAIGTRPLFNDLNGGGFGHFQRVADSPNHWLGSDCPISSSPRGGGPATPLLSHQQAECACAKFSFRCLRLCGHFSAYGRPSRREGGFRTQWPVTFWGQVANQTRSPRGKDSKEV